MDSETRCPAAWCSSPCAPGPTQEAEMSLSTRSTILAAALVSLSLAACSSEKSCASDQQLCQGACVGLATDPANCGACGAVCGAGQNCASGTCVYGTAQNCGAPGRTCATGERCVSGDCLADLYLACFDTNEVREA